MVSMTTTLCWRPPPLAVIVSGNVPNGDGSLVDTVIVDAPDVVTADGEKLALVSAGSPLTLNATAPENPPDGVTVTV